MITSENGLLRGTVLLNVRGRDIGSFVDEAKSAIARQVQIPAGYYVEWSGQYENQQRARSRLLLVVPIVLIVIFASALHDLSLRARGGSRRARGAVRIDWRNLSTLALGYNFSVAVWVGFIALFGTAVQTGGGDGDLSARSGREEAERSRSTNHERSCWKLLLKARCCGCGQK